MRRGSGPQARKPGTHLLPVDQCLWGRPTGLVYPRRTDLQNVQERATVCAREDLDTLRLRRLFRRPCRPTQSDARSEPRPPPIADS